MTTAREIMTEGAEYAKDREPVSDVARRLSQADIGLVPVCDDNGRLSGVISDRDIVVKVVAEGLDPKTTQARQLLDQREVVTIGADDDLGEVLRTMEEHRVRRLPVIDGRQLVGMLAQADLAGRVSEKDFSRLLEVISS